MAKKYKPPSSGSISIAQLVGMASAQWIIIPSILIGCLIKTGKIKRAVKGQSQ